MKLRWRILSLASALLTCSPNNPQQTSHFVSEVSPCGGFVSLSKSAIITYIRDSSEYCEAEKLRWAFDAASNELDLLHTRYLQNCAAELTIEARINDDVVEIMEMNTSTVTARCMCYFDTYSKISNISGKTRTIIIKGKSFAINLEKSSGVIILDSTQNWPCSIKKESIFSYYAIGNVSMVQIQEFDSLYSSNYIIRRTIVDPDTITALLDLLRILPGEGDIMVKFGGGVSFQKAIFMESDTKYDTVEIVGKRVKTPATSFYHPEKDDERQFVQLLLAE